MSEIATTVVLTYRDMSTRGERAVGVGPGAKRRGPQVVHLPSWSQLRIATKQRTPAGRGGDFYEIVQHRSGHVSAVMADVAGNGPSAAGPVSELRWVIRQRLARGDAPAAVLTALNESLIQQKTHDRFVTAICLRFDPQIRRVDVASAGHLGPFIKRGGVAEELAMSVGLALGILPAQIYQETTVELESEDALVMVTDGITDRLGTPANPLGQEGLVARLARARSGAEAICGALLGNDAPLGLDATVIVMQLPRRHRRSTPVPARSAG
jgi:sigma-B regulation protein RsbU (phosphoserine phosphatase)